MKLIAVCLFAACCYSLASAIITNGPDTTYQRKKLEEVLRQLYDVKEIMQHNEKMLSTPPENIEDCCCLSALQCFKANMEVHFNTTERNQKKLLKSLKSHLTMRGLNFCNSESQMSTCQTCDSHPQVTVQVFLNRLESLIQRGITKLSMK
uniref:Interleukin n=1 Tax=Echeneis naucrates TaxID=173247 RepID=A0A665TS72_ECHNA